MRTQFLCTHLALLRTVTAVGVLTVCALSAARTEAQTNSTWNGGTGNWSNATNWSNGVPNGDFNALISNGGPVSTANLDISATIANLGLDSGNTLNILSGSSLTFQSTTGSAASGSGTINLNSGGSIIVGSGNSLTVMPSVNMRGSGSRITGATGSESISLNSLTGSGTISNLQVFAESLTAEGGVLTIKPNRQGLGVDSILNVAKGSTLNITGGPFLSFDPQTGVFQNFGSGFGTGTHLQGTLQFDNANILTLSVGQHLTLDGPGAQIINQSGQNGLSNLSTLLTAAQLTLLNGATLTTKSDLNLFSFTSTLVSSGSILRVGGNLSLSSGFGIQVDHAVLDVAGNLVSQSTDQGAPINVTNRGVLNIGGNYSSNSNTGLAVQLVAAGASAINIAGDFSQTGASQSPGFFSNSTSLTGGSSMNLKGSLNISGSSILTVDGGSVLNVAKNITLIAATNSTPAPALLLSNGSVGNVRGNLSNSGGTVQVDGSSLLNVTSGISQTTGTTTIDGVLNAPGHGLNIQGGTLSGSGIVHGNVAMSGSMMPGNPTGIFTIDGNYTQTSSGSLIEQVGWINRANSSLLQVNGTADLDGTLALSLLSGFKPTAGDSFILMTFFNEFGAFSTVTGLNLGNNEFLQLFYDPHDLRVDVVQTPEPSTLVLLLVGAASIVFATLRLARVA